MPNQQHPFSTMRNMENELIECEDEKNESAEKSPWERRQAQASAESTPPATDSLGNIPGYEAELAALRKVLPPWFMDLAKAFGKNFLIGFTWQMLLQAFPMVFKGKFRGLKTLFSPENFVGFCQRGSMLGVWVVQFRLLMKLFVNGGGKFPKNSAQFTQQCNKVGLCGFISGVSSLYTIGGLHWSMCLYFACRSMRAVMDVAYAEHWFPEWLEKMPTWLLFAIVCGPTASHPLLYKANYVPKGYLDFVGAATSQNIDKLNYMYPNSMEVCQPCQPHYHEGPCFQNALKGLRHSLTYLMKFYMIFYTFFRVLLRSPKQLLNSPLHTLKAIIRNSIGSSLFVSCVGWAACLLPCIYRPTLGYMTPLTVMPWCMLTACGLYFEGPSRQSELIVYNISCTIEGFVNYYFDQSVRVYPPLPTPPFLTKIVGPLLFGLASAAWVWTRHHSPEIMRNTEKKILNHVLPLEPKYVRFADEVVDKPHVINSRSFDPNLYPNSSMHDRNLHKKTRSDGLQLLELLTTSIASAII